MILKTYFRMFFLEVGAVVISTTVLGTTCLLQLIAEVVEDPLRFWRQRFLILVILLIRENTLMLEVDNG